jgi:hypothetical protein
MALKWNGRTKTTLMLLGTLAALLLGLITGPATSQASTSPYCGGNLGPRGYCVGATRWLYQAYGWGDQAGVCVAVWEHTVRACTTSPGTGVYSANVGSNVWALPYIDNNSGVTNYVHGVALTH